MDASQEQRPGLGLQEAQLSPWNTSPTRRRCGFPAARPPGMGPESRRVLSALRSGQSLWETLSHHEDKGLQPQEPLGCMVW